jgi:hypothetical protein
MPVRPSIQLRTNGEHRHNGLKFPFMLSIVEAFFDFFSEN